jgi:hypothetical protein
LFYAAGVRVIYAHYTPQYLRETVAKYSATPAELVAELEVERDRRRDRRC